MKGYSFEKKTTIEDRKQMKAMRMNGFSLPSIAKTFNLDHTTVMYHLRKMNIGIPKIKRRICRELNVVPKKNVYFLPEVLHENKRVLKTYKDYLKDEEEERWNELINKVPSK